MGPQTRSAQDDTCLGYEESRPLSSHQNGLGEHLLNPSDRLPGALFVLDQAESYVAVAVVAEAYAGAYGYLRFRQQ
jgi:hypothetical protein